MMLETTESRDQRPDEETISTMAADLVLWLDDKVDTWFNSKDLKRDYDISGDWVKQALRSAMTDCKYALALDGEFETAIGNALDEAEDDHFADEDDD
jgi:hypothetical protein